MGSEVRMKVLLPIDGSPCSRHAVEHVIASRARWGDGGAMDIHLVNVQPTVSGDISQFVSSTQLAAYHAEESTKALAEARALLDAAGLKYTLHTRTGHAAAEIAALADALQCDQIVMGTHGRGALAELLVGGTTLRVVHLTKMPVLLVK